MNEVTEMRLFVCYVPGLDRRRLTTEQMLDVGKIAGAIDGLRVSDQMLLRTIRFSVSAQGKFMGLLLIFWNRIGYGHFDFFDNPVDVLQIRTLGRLDVHIGS